MISMNRGDTEEVIMLGWDPAGVSWGKIGYHTFQGHNNVVLKCLVQEQSETLSDL